MAEAEAHLANVRATNAEAQAKYGASAASARYVLAANNVEKATKAVTLAQGKSASMAGLVSGAWGLIGGPIGAITLGVTALAATYMYFSSKSAEATAKLKEQAEAAKLTKEEIKALNDEQRKEKLGDLAATLEDQNKALHRQELAVGSALINIQNYAVGNTKVAEISREARLGTISYTEAIEQLKNQKIPSDLMDALLKQVNAYDEAAETATKTKQTYSLFGFEVIIAGNKAENAIVGVDKNTKSLSENEKAALAAKNAQKKYADSLHDREFEAYLTKGLLAKGYSPEKVNQMVETANWARKNGVKITNELYQTGLQVLSIEEKNKEVIDAKNKALKDSTKELEKQQKVLNVNAKVQENAKKYGFSNLETKYGILPGLLSAINMQESKGKSDAIGPKTKYGTAKGGFQMLDATAKRWELAGKEVFDTGKSAEAAAKYLHFLFQKFGDWEKAISAYHAGEGNVEKGTNIGPVNRQYVKNVKGYVAGASGLDLKGVASRDFDLYLKDYAKNQEEIKQLQIAYDSEAIARSKKREEEINKATILGQSKLIPKINERFDAEDNLAQKQFDFEVNGYKWTEEKKLEYTYETNSLRLVAEGKLSEEQRKIALGGFEQQKQQELAILKLAQEQRLFQAKQALLTETQAIQERYRLEREHIKATTKDAKELQEHLALSKSTQDKETRDKVNNAVQNWGGIQADMNGTGEFFRQDQERSSRLGSAYNLLDSQLASTDFSEKNSLDTLNAQFEQQLISQQDFENQKTAIIQAAQDQRDLIGAEYTKNVQEVEDKYQQDRLNTQLMYGQQMTGSLTSMFGSMFGEQSKAYKLMFAADKAYAIAAAGIAIQQNIAAASKAGFPLNIPLIAGAVAQGASIIANIRAIKDQGFANGGYTGPGGKYDVAGLVHRGEVVFSQKDVARNGGVAAVESIRKGGITPSDSSDLFHDGKIYFSSNGLVSERSNLDDVQDFTLGRSSGPQTEIMPSIVPSSPVINFKIEVVNQVSGAKVEAEQLDDNTIRIIVKEELDKQLPKAVPKLVSDQIGNPNSTISRSLTENTTARRNR